MHQIRFEAERLTAGHRKIADYIVKHLQNIPYMTEQDLAAQTGISVATVSRFWKSAGYANFKDFKRQLQGDAAPTPAGKMADKLRKVADDDLAGKMLELEIRHLAITMERLSREDFQFAVDSMIRARQIFVYGSGPSHSLCELLYYRLNRFGYRVNHISRGGSELFEWAGQLGASDVLIVFGFANTPPEAKVLLELARQANCPSVLVTDAMVSELVDLADAVLYTCRGESGEFHSMVAPVALVDSLTVAMAKQDEERALASLHRLYDLRQRLAPSMQYKR
ncbi:MurR/RpiR family transcriptional regulator [Paenibacillus sepulcri]